MAALLWARLVFLVLLVTLVGVYAWTAYQTTEEEERRAGQWKR